MNKKENLSVINNATVKSLLHDGFAEAHSESDNFHVPFVLPNEKILYEKYSTHKRNFYNLKDVLEKSSHRVAADCPYFTVCGGCLLQHMDKDFYKNYKISNLKENLLDHNINVQLEEIKIVPQSSRRRANLEAKRRNEELFFGFHQLKNHRLVNVQNCIALTLNLQYVLPYIRECLDKILKNHEKAKIFLLENDSKIDVGLEIQDRPELSIEEIDLIEKILKPSQVTRFQFRYRKKFIKVFEKERIFATHGSLRVEVDAWAFMQASEQAEEWMKSLVLKNAYLEDKTEGLKILDLFSGRGTFSGILAEIGDITAVESDPRAIECLEKSVNSERISIVRRDLFTEPLSSQELSKFELAIVDPPRAGAENQILELAKSKIRKIIYISCNPESFARDAKILINSEYKLLKLYPIDQFLWTPHLEVIGIFEK